MCYELNEFTLQTLRIQTFLHECAFPVAKGCGILWLRAVQINQLHMNRPAWHSKQNIIFKQIETWPKTNRGNSHWTGRRRVEKKI
jgi:hypothetical protein